MLNKGLVIILLLGLFSFCEKAISVESIDMTGNYGVRVGQNCTVPDEEGDQVFLTIRKGKTGRYLIELSPKISTQAGFPSKGEQTNSSDMEEFSFLLEDDNLKDISTHLEINQLNDTYIEVSKWEVVKKNAIGESTTDILELLSSQAIKDNKQNYILWGSICLANLKNEPYSLFGFVINDYVPILANINPQSINKNLPLTDEACPIGVISYPDYINYYRNKNCQENLPQMAKAQSAVFEERKALEKAFSKIDACMLNGRGSLDSCKDTIRNIFPDKNASIQQNEFGDIDIEYSMNIPDFGDLSFELSVFYYNNKVYWRNNIYNAERGNRCYASALCAAFDPNLIYVGF